MALNIFSSGFITIDIGFRNIKVVKVKVNKNNLSVMKYGIGRTPLDCIKNGDIKNKLPVINEIKKVIEENGLESKEAKILISGINIVTRILMVEKVAKQELDKKILDQIKLLLPINVDEHKIDFKILGEVIEDGTTMVKVFVTAVPKKIINSYMEILESLNLKPLSVDIPANSVSKFFQNDVRYLGKESTMNEYQFSKLKSSDTFAVIDLGSETTIINVLKNKIPEFNRVILKGSSDIDLAILKELNLDNSQLETSEKYKKLYGIVKYRNTSNDLEWVVSQATLSVMEKIVKDINSCFDFYLNRCGGNQIGKIYIIGGGSQLKGLKEYFESELHIPVHQINALEIDGISFADGLDKEKANFLINALGASL